MTDSITAILTNDISALVSEGKDVTATEIAEGLVKLGWVKGKPQRDEPHPLSAYKDGEHVQVIKDGDWMPGVINGVEKRLGLLYVHTERGPVSIASNKFIRKVPVATIE